MAEQEAVPVVAITPPPGDLLKQVILAEGKIDDLLRQIRDREQAALSAIEDELAPIRADLEKTQTQRQDLLEQAYALRVFEQDRYILLDRSRETRIPRLDAFRQAVPSDQFMLISETTIRLGKADAILGKARVDALCDLQRGPPVMVVTRKDEKKYYQTAEGFWRSK